MLYDFAPMLNKPGLFVTATDTGVGKTIITCAIAAALRAIDTGNSAFRVGACKPYASGCIVINGELVNEDAIALRRFAGDETGQALPLDVINPVRFKAAVAPGVAMQIEPAKPASHESLLSNMMIELDAQCDRVLVEGVGGLLVPLDDRHTVLDLIKTIDYPVVVVARSSLGTLNHTALTVSHLKDRGCRVVGVVMNGYDAEAIDADESIATNREWIEKLTGVKVLAVVPQCDPQNVQAHEGIIDEAILQAVAEVDWSTHCDVPRKR